MAPLLPDGPRTWGPLNFPKVWKTAGLSRALLQAEDMAVGTESGRFEAKVCE